MVLLLRESIEKSEFCAAMEALEASFSTFQLEMRRGFAEFESKVVAYINKTSSLPPQPTTPLYQPPSPLLSSPPSPTFPPHTTTPTGTDFPPYTSLSLHPQPKTPTQPTFDELLKNHEIALSAAVVSTSDVGQFTPVESPPSETLSENQSLAFNNELDDVTYHTFFPTTPFHSPSLLLHSNTHHQLPVFESKCPFYPLGNITASHNKSENYTSTPASHSPAPAPPKCLYFGSAGPILRALYARAEIHWTEEPPGIFGSLAEKSHRSSPIVIIIGVGILGIVVAPMLQNASYKVNLLDSQDRIGEGRSYTDTRTYGLHIISCDVLFYDDEFVYGIPEHTTSLALKPTRGPEVEFSEPYKLFNPDVFEYIHESSFVIYRSIPLMISHGKFRGSSGFFWINAAEKQINVLGHGWNGEFLSVLKLPSDQKRINTLGMSEAGAMDAFIFVGPWPKDIVRQNTTVTEAPALPLLFVDAYHQYRWNYRKEEDVFSVDAKFDEHDMPYDVWGLDIEHTDGNKYCTWDRMIFPNQEEMQKKLAAESRRMVTIVDPHIKRDDSYHIHKELSEKRYVLVIRALTKDLEKLFDEAVVDFVMLQLKCMFPDASDIVQCVVSRRVTDPNTIVCYSYDAVGNSDNIYDLLRASVGNDFFGGEAAILEHHLITGSIISVQLFMLDYHKISSHHMEFLLSRDCVFYAATGFANFVLSFSPTIHAFFGLVGVRTRFCLLYVRTVNNGAPALGPLTTLLVQHGALQDIPLQVTLLLHKSRGYHHLEDKVVLKEWGDDTTQGISRSIQVTSSGKITQQPNSEDTTQCKKPDKSSPTSEEPRPICYRKASAKLRD